MKITAIKQQVKRTDRYSLYIEGKYSFSLSEAEVAQLGLKEGYELTAEKLFELRAEAVLSKAYDRALRYLAIRPRSLYEMTSYLKRKGYEAEVIDTIVDRLFKLELLDDAKFARQWVQWRLNSKPSSKRKLQAELAQKRIDREIVKEVLDEIDSETELEQIKELISRKQKLSQYQDPQKLMAYLARQGFSYDLIKKALAEKSD